MIEEYSVVLPKLGESILDATVVRWFKKEGDLVHLDEPLLEVATDKVNSEIPSPVTGVLLRIVVPPDEEVHVGNLLAVIRLEKALSVERSSSSAVEEGKETAQTKEKEGMYSPALLRLAHEYHLSLEDLKKVPATGAEGRLSKRDLERYIERTRESKQAQCPSVVSHETVNIERIRLSGMRKTIAENMVKSFYEAPHATLITEVDVTNVNRRIQTEKETFWNEHNGKLTITSFVALAISGALREYPLLNSSLDGDTIVLKKYINLGIAVSVDQGILVPVIKGCQNRTLPEMVRSIGDLSSRARLGKLLPEEVQEGTITLTNFGISGVAIGVPIIRYPEVAIVGMGAITKKVVALDDDTFGIRSVMYLSLTFDHRVIDGMYGCGFLTSVQNHLENKVLH